MKTEIHIEPGCPEPKLILVTPELTHQQQKLLELFAREGMLPGYQGQRVKKLAMREIFRFYTEHGQVLAETESESWNIKMRLYELEEQLSETDFIRISQSELINLAQVQQFDLSFSGTIQVLLKNGSSTYVSRRYVKKIKQALGI